MKIALLQMTSGIDPMANGDALVTAVHEAAANGATMLFTPEMSGLLDSNGKRADPLVMPEATDTVLSRVRAAAREAGIWVHLGSLALKAGDDPRWLNRGFVIDSNGGIVARYDKMHLFDVDLDTGESWRESARYVPGSGPVVTQTPVGVMGLSVCYDMRFPALYQALSGAGAMILSVPAAFTVPTGRAHWHTLLRARAIENACFLVATAQVGHHQDGRSTYGHSLVIDPWGSVMLDMGEMVGLGYCDIDPAAATEVRKRVPVIAHRRAIPAVDAVR